ATDKGKNIEVKEKAEEQGRGLKKTEEGPGEQGRGIEKAEKGSEGIEIHEDKNGEDEKDEDMQDEADKDEDKNNDEADKDEDKNVEDTKYEDEKEVEGEWAEDPDHPVKERLVLKVDGRRLVLDEGDYEVVKGHFQVPLDRLVEALGGRLDRGASGR